MHDGHTAGMRSGRNDVSLAHGRAIGFRQRPRQLGIGNDDGKFDSHTCYLTRKRLSVSSGNLADRFEANWWCAIAAAGRLYPAFRNIPRIGRIQAAQKEARRALCPLIPTPMVGRITGAGACARGNGSIGSNRKRLQND
jgi:hypothetical protein